MNSCQDTWIWENYINIKNEKKFKSYMKDGIIMGIPGCDNYIVYLLDYNGYKVENRCKLINCFHLHQNNFRSWKHSDKNSYVREFYKTIKCS